MGLLPCEGNSTVQVTTHIVFFVTPIAAEQPTGSFEPTVFKRKLSKDYLTCKKQQANSINVPSSRLRPRNLVILVGTI